MTSGPGSICFACSLFTRNWPEGVPTCNAFPRGIPDAILYGAFDHREEFGGEEMDENGDPILFELDPDEEDSLEAYERMKELLAEE